MKRDSTGRIHDYSQLLSTRMPLDIMTEISTYMNRAEDIDPQMRYFKTINARRTAERLGMMGRGMKMHIRSAYDDSSFVHEARKLHYLSVHGHEMPPALASISLKNPLLDVKDVIHLAAIRYEQFCTKHAIETAMKTRIGLSTIISHAFPHSHLGGYNGREGRKRVTGRGIEEIARKLGRQNLIDAKGKGGDLSEYVRTYLGREPNPKAGRLFSPITDIDINTDDSDIPIEKRWL